MNKLREAIVNSISQAMMRQEGVPFDIEEVQDANKSIDDIIDALLETLPEAMDVVTDSSIFEMGYNASLRITKQRLLQAKESKD